jgi:hypothetical protein
MFGMGFCVAAGGAMTKIAPGIGCQEHFRGCCNGRIAEEQCAVAAAAVGSGGSGAMVEAYSTI